MKQEIFITVDAVIFRIAENGKIGDLLLVKRKNDPFKDQWALPGGFLEKDELLEMGAKRELQEETGLKIEGLKQVGIFDSPDRDPRGRTISVAYYGFADPLAKVKANDDAEEVKWFLICHLPELAFDHENIIKKAIEINL